MTSHTVATETPNRATETSWGKWDTGLAVGLWILAVAAARTILSWDSFEYLSSAKSLFSDDIGRWYEWIREPLYPLVIRISAVLFGPSDLGMVAVQATIVVLAVAWFSNQWFRGRRWIRRTAMVLIIANPVVLGFTGFVGQQALLLALVCATAAWMSMIADSQRSSQRLIVAIAAGLGIAWVLTAALFVPIVVAVAAYVWLAPRWSYAQIQLLRTTYIDRETATRAAIVLVLSGVIALSAWWAFKAVVISDADNASTMDHHWIWEYGDPPPSSTNNTLSQKILAFLALGPDDIVNPWVAKELVIFSGIHPDTSDRCGVVTSGDPATIDYTKGYIKLSCRPVWAFWLHQSLAPIGLILYRVSLMALFLGTVAGVFASRFRVFSLIAVAFLLPYLVGGIGISRYAVPLYPLGIAVLLTLAAAFIPQHFGTGRTEVD